MSTPPVTPADSAAPLLEARDLHLRFRQNRFGPASWVHALNGVDLRLHAGETLGILGETGCGKSTLCRTLMGLHRPRKGQVLLDGRDIHGKGMTRHRVASLQMVFQDPADSLNPRLTIGDIVAEPLVIRTGKPADSHRERVEELLARTGLPADISDRYPHEFSGGQRQRIAIARALILAPRILVCDEPVSALDVSVQAQILNLLLDLQEERGLALVFVSHALGVVRHMSDRVLVMYLGLVMEEGTASRIWEAPAHPYTRTLMAAHPALEDMTGPATGPTQGAPGSDPRAALPRSAPGTTGQDDAQARSLPDNREPPTPLHIPAGCPYQAACPLAFDRCLAERPLLRQVGPGHRVACHRS